METKLQSKQQYPRFIQNKPCGIDKFDGGSQERLAKTIARHFCQNDSLDEECTLPRIIGIEGIWGSGKSNVVKMLERELSDDYYFFEYDAWGHQEDLQRRSILELLTSKLIDDGILSGNATIKALDEEIEEKAIDLANSKVEKAKSMLQENAEKKEQNMDELIDELAEIILKDNKSYLGSDISDAAIAELEKDKEENHEVSKKKTKTRNKSAN